MTSPRFLRRERLGAFVGRSRSLPMDRERRPSSDGRAPLAGVHHRIIVTPVILFCFRAVLVEPALTDPVLSPGARSTLRTATRTTVCLSRSAARAALEGTLAPDEGGADISGATPLDTSTSSSPSTVTVEGSVVDEAGRPVPGADVRLSLAGEAGTLRTTDVNGGFRFLELRPGRYRLEVSARRRVAVRRIVDVERTAPPLRIVLAMSRLVETVTVTPSRTSERLVDAASSVRVLDEEDLESTAALRMDDVLRQIPGFTLFRRTSSSVANPTTQGASLRGIGGSGASRILALEDGVPLNDPFGGWIAWGRIPRSAVERVEVLRGGSSLYGTSALAGVVHLVRRADSVPRVDVEASAGNLGLRDVSLWAAGPLGAWGGGSLAAEVDRTAGYVPVEEASRGPIDRRAESSQRAIELTGTHGGDDGPRAFLRVSLFDEQRANGTAFQKNSTDLRQVSMGWDGSLGGDLSLRAFGAWEHYDQSFSSVSVDRSEETPTRQQSIPSHAFGLLSQWKGAIGSSTELLAGLEAGRVVGESREEVLTGTGGMLAAGGAQDTGGAFIESRSRIGGAIAMGYGGRYDRWTNDGKVVSLEGVRAPSSRRTEEAWNPRLWMTLQPTSDLSLSGSVYRTFRAPTLNELYRAFRVGNVLTLANDALDAERLTGAEAGAQLVPKSGELVARGRLFWMTVSDAITNVTIDSTPSLITRQRKNVGRTRSRGSEIDMEARWALHYSASFAYLFTDAVVVDADQDPSLEGRRVPQVPRNQATLQLAYTGGRARLALQTRWSGPAFDDDRNALSLASAFTVDTLMSIPVNSRLAAFASGENLFDRRVETGRTPVLTLGSPRTIRIGLRAHWPRTSSSF